MINVYDLHGLKIKWRKIRTKKWCFKHVGLFHFTVGYKKYFCAFNPLVNIINPF